MDSNTIKKLLDKYWDGDTNLLEESQLRDFFNQEEVPAELKEFQPFFVYLKEEQLLQTSDDFESRLKSKLELTDTTKVKQLPIRTILMRVAAAAVLVFAVFYFVPKNDIKPVSEEIVWKDTYDDPKEAYAKTKEVLLLLSKKINQGTNTAANSLKKGEVATSKLK